jgi:hypothetical protein
MKRSTKTDLNRTKRSRTLSHVLRGLVGSFVLIMSMIFGVSTTAIAQTGPTFEHDLTRFPLTGDHKRVNCEDCHVGGQFAGTPTSCQSCHAGGGSRAETRPSARHIPIQTDCNDCHVTRFWEPARMDHSSVGDNCQTCHNGGTASGKPVNHIQSSNQCGDCHGTRTWRGATFDHDLITTNCVSCHNGSTARGKNTNHLPTGNDCEVCHSTRRWVPASSFDHSGVTAACFTCHNGTIATGKTPTHIQSSNDCEVCHTQRAWLPAGFDHANVMPGTCNSCHNGMTADGPPSGHFSSPLSCDACHSTNSWGNADFDHGGVAYPGDHRVSLDCTDCHGGNSSMVTWSSPAYLPDCAGCHANDFEVGGPHKTATVSDLRDCAGSCHTSPEHSVREREW